MVLYNKELLKDVYRWNFDNSATHFIVKFTHADKSIAAFCTRWAKMLSQSLPLENTYCKAMI